MTEVRVEGSGLAYARERGAADLAADISSGACERRSVTCGISTPDDAGCRIALAEWGKAAIQEVANHVT